MKMFFRAMRYSWAALVLTAFVVPYSAHAQTTGMQISPLTYDFTMDPGSSQSGKMNLRNLDNEDLNYVLETELFSQVTDEGAPSFEGTVRPEGVTSLADWITFSEEKEGTIAANGQVDLHFEINVPEGAEPGGHYAAIFAKQIKKDVTGKTQLGVSSRVGLLILVSVPGDVKKTAVIESFTLPKIIWRGPLDLNMKVANTGSVHFDSVSSVEFEPIIGNVQTVDLGEHTILPNNTRSFVGQWLNKYPFGYYKVAASATDGDGNKIVVNSSVWAIPLIIIVPLLLAVILLWIIIHYVKKNFKVVKANN